MNEEQMETLNTTQEVLRILTLALCTTNPGAMPRVAYALRAGAAAPAVSPVAAKMLEDLATGVELFEGKPGKH